MHRFLPALATRRARGSPRCRCATTRARRDEQVRARPHVQGAPRPLDGQVPLRLVDEADLPLRRQRRVPLLSPARSSSALDALYEKLVNGVYVYRQPVAPRRRVPLPDRRQPDPARPARRADHPHLPRVAGEADLPRARASQLRGAAAARVAAALIRCAGSAGSSGATAVDPRGARADDRRRSRHRGPDDDGYYRPRRTTSGLAVGLGFRRLSIIDLDGGQPADGERGRLAAASCFNGEIYNFRELRRSSRRAATASDATPTPRCSCTSTRSAASDCVERLNGMFAFALWDERRRELVLARDRFGKKPLYYAEIGELAPLRLGAQGAPRASALPARARPRARSAQLPGARVRARAALDLRRGQQAAGRPRPSSGETGGSSVERVLGPLVRAATSRARRTTSTSTSSAARSARGGAAAPRQRRAARRVPERRHRLELGRRDDGRPSCRRRT